MLELTVARPDAEIVVLPDAAEGHIQVWEEDGRACAYGYSAADRDWMHVPEVATFQFQNEDDRVVAIPVNSARIDFVAEVFERTVLPMALQAFRHEVLHASAVLMPQGVVAFSGHSGAGKSTLAHLMNLRGYRCWADDAVMFDRSADVVRAVPLPFKINLRADSACFFGLRPGERLPAGSTASQPAPLVTVIVLAPRPAHRSQVGVRRLSAAEAFKAVLTQAYCYKPSDSERNARMVEEYLGLTARVPIFEVRFPAGFDYVDQLAARIEEVVGGATV